LKSGKRFAKVKILVCGASGYIGQHLFRGLGNRAEVSGASFSQKCNDSRIVQSDLAGRDEAAALFAQARPEVIINCAGLTSPGYCETHPDEAERLNVTLVENLIKAGQDAKVRFFQFSTDNVFSGKTGGYTETALPDPINVYGQTKRQAELSVERSGLPFAIVRVSLVYGRSYSRKPGADEDIVKQLREKRAYKAFVDEYRSPMCIDDLCVGIWKLIESGESGYFHFGEGRVSRFEFARRVARLNGFSEASIIPVSSGNTEHAYPRPADTSLDARWTKERLKSAFNVTVHPPAGFGNICL
jgi:dTDP-4-dehydrorhamnose reductase